MSETEPAKSTVRRRVRGRYALSERLGGGGQGTTWEAVDEQEGRIVAVKEFRVRGARSWKDVELAQREAEILATLDHPLLPHYLDHFEEDGVLYLVMDRMEGTPMARGTQVRHCSAEEVISFLADAAEILDYLHGRAPPIIHRDIKPANVLRLPSGSFGLVDFGAVRAELRPDGGSTVVGTFGFMAPEQFQGRALPATDVYAVGATALTFLTGRPPEELPHRGLGIDVARALAGQTLPGGLTEALSRMLEPDPDERAVRIRPLLENIEHEPKRYRVSNASDAPQASRGHARRPGATTEARRTSRREAVDFDDAGDAVHLPHAAVFVFKLGLLVARMAVALALGFVVPTLLVLLAIVFGPGLHRAARTVRAAGRRADDALARASSVVRSEHAPRRRRRKAKHWRRRVATQGAEDGGRIRRQRVVDDGAVDAPRWSEADDEDRAEEAGAPDTDAGIDRDAARKRPRR